MTILQYNLILGALAFTSMALFVLLGLVEAKAKALEIERDLWRKAYHGALDLVGMDRRDV